MRKEKMASYVRESNEFLSSGTTTMESQIQLVRTYGAREGYIFDPELEFTEAISAVSIPYLERPQMMAMLEAARKKLFDVLVVSEIRAISRQQVEVLVIYSELQKYGIRLETVTEKFGNDAMSKAIIGLRAMFAEIEVEQARMRTSRGRRDRIEIGYAPNGSAKPPYGYRFLDTDKEVKGSYEFNHTIIFVDSEGVEWSEYTVALLLFDMAARRMTLDGIATYLNELGIPPPKKPRKGLVAQWRPSTIHCLLQNRIYIGEVWCNKFKSVRNPQTRKRGYVRRPVEEQTLLEGIAPPMVDGETFEYIQVQLAWNKQDALRNNKHGNDLGLLRGGFARCGICGGSMYVDHPRSSLKKQRSPVYACRQKRTSGDFHNTVITVDILDREVLAKIREVLLHPEMIRVKVAKLREDNTPVADPESIDEALEIIKKKMQNLFDLAESCSDDETLEDLKLRLRNYEKQRRQAEALLAGIEEDEEERAEVEAEIVRFEKWVEEVRPELANPDFVPSYEALRMAVRVIGIVAEVFPVNGDYPFRAQVEATIPGITGKMTSCNDNDGRQCILFSWTI